MIKSCNRDVDRKRAFFAYEKINENLINSIYLSHIKRAPMLVLNNGLLPTLAFYKDKNKKIFDDIEDYIKQAWFNYNQKKLKDNVMYKISQLPQAEYRFWTKDVLAFLVWMKRFAEGVENSIENKVEEDKNE